MNNYAAHQILVKTFMLSFQKEFPNGRIFQRHVGLFYTVKKTPIKINSPGMADLWAIIDGKHFEFEIKTGTGKQTAEQKNWQRTITDLLGHYILVKDIETAMHDIKLIIKN